MCEIVLCLKFLQTDEECHCSCFYLFSSSCSPLFHLCPTLLIFASLTLFSSLSSCNPPSLFPISPLSLSFNIFLSAPSPSHYRSISLSLYFFFPAISLFAAAAVCPNLSHPLHTLSCRSPFLLSPFLPPSFSHLPLILLSVMQDKDTGITYGRVVMALRYLNPLI